MDKLRYTRFKCGRWRWEPTPRMKKLGFRMITLGRDLTEDAKLQSISLSADWDRARKGHAAGEVQPIEKVYAKGTIGDLYQQIMILREQERAAAGVVWTNDQIKRDDWPRAWRHLAPVVGDVKPHQVTTKIIFAIYTKMKASSPRPRHTESSRCGARCGSG